MSTHCNQLFKLGSPTKESMLHRHTILNAIRQSCTIPAVTICAVLSMTAALAVWTGTICAVVAMPFCGYENLTFSGLLRIVFYLCCTDALIYNASAADCIDFDVCNILSLYTRRLGISAGSAGVEFRCVGTRQSRLTGTLSDN
ncbi:uncharacterized protein PHALS_08849 [Plasmopara halstedii]|uniref:Uncharacterized protein n=1 Tax=Plasmopara halstedii TaxID=4781 RepID=A0A0P1AEC6_PLAHL|nr:uncharacterized protein PHALS_08849 [Plasmopara halstedii]CEG38796.1 hypothetical protein PHALS_08849 [Plasmopara halstedii]|eukprot:XP_024575165.1 hypothetical protein PHALS_08849 [Plasmopara halstedii]